MGVYIVTDDKKIIDSTDMTHLEAELQLLKDDILELLFLVKSQLEKCEKSLFNFDLELAEEIRSNEKRVDSLELKIDRDCENIFALYNPVAIDLRLVMATFKINSDLERIGDHANSIANYVLDFGQSIEKSAADQIRLDEMFKISIQMLSDIFDAVVREDTDLSRNVIKKDKILNEINRTASAHAAELIRNDIENIQNYLYLFSIIRKLERVGDLVKNVAEELIFYLEAKILKHKKMKAKNNS